MRMFSEEKHRWSSRRKTVASSQPLQGVRRLAQVDDDEERHEAVLHEVVLHIKDLNLNFGGSFKITLLSGTST